MVALNLEVGIDAAGVVSGVQNAFTALDRMANSARIATNALEAVGKTGGAISALGTAIGRLHPYLLAATTLMSGLTLGMQLLSGDANKAAKAVDNLTESMAKAQRGQQAAQMLGVSQSSYIKQQVDVQMQAFAESLLNKPSNAGEVGGRLGVGGLDLAAMLAAGGNAQAMQYMLSYDAKTGSGQYRTGGLANIGSRTGPIFEMSSDLSGISVSAKEQQDLYMRSFRDRSRQSEAYDADRRGLGPYAPGGGGGGGGASGFPFNAQPDSWQYPGIGRPFRPGEQNAIDEGMVATLTRHNEATARQDAQAMAEAMREVEHSAQRAGMYAGDMAHALITGAATFSEVMQQVLSDMLRMGLQAGATSLFQGMFSGFGATPTQAKG